MRPISPRHPLILASTSPYRAQLLARLQVPFAAVAPGVDEHALPRESAARQATRLALAKARAVAERHPDRWILGSDQVLRLGALKLGKPGTRAAAIAQLRKLSGATAEFVTAVALVGGASGAEHLATDRTRVSFRRLTAREIGRYVAREPALDCAGSFKSEALGIALFEEIRARDPTALIGLPLIETCRLLALAGYAVL